MVQHAYKLHMCNYIGPRKEFFRPEEVHAHHVIIGMETGAFEYTVGKQTGTASFGDLVIVPPGSLFKRKSLGEITFHMLVFTPLMEPDPLLGVLPSGKVTINDVNRLSSTYSYLRKTWLEYGSLSKENHLSMHMLMDLLHLTLLEYKYMEKRRKKKEPRMQLAAGYIHRHLFDDLSMKRIADNLGLKPSDLTRRFRLEYGVTPIEYATNLRLEEAKKLLLETDYTLDTIASLCGYENGSYLGRVFRSKVGINPSNFRRNNHI
jgi:AraC-like DNA-binding protein